MKLLFIYLSIILNSFCFSQKEDLSKKKLNDIQTKLSIPSFFIFDTLVEKSQFVSLLGNDSIFNVNNIEIRYTCGDMFYYLDYFIQGDEIIFNKGDLDLYFLLKRNIDTNNLPNFNRIFKILKNENIGVKKIKYQTENIGTYKDKYLKSGLMFFIVFSMYDYSNLKYYNENSDKYLSFDSYNNLPQISEYIKPLICFKSSRCRYSKHLTKSRRIYLNLINNQIINDQYLCDFWKYF
jgi:hypothetical protein